MPHCNYPTILSAIHTCILTLYIKKIGVYDFKNKTYFVKLCFD